MASGEIVRQVKNAVGKHRTALAAMRQNGAKELANSIAAIEQEILRVLEAFLAGPPASEAGRIANLVQTLNEIIANSLTEELGPTAESVQRVMRMAEDLRKTTTAMTFGKAAFTQIGVEQITDAFENFERGRTHRQLFRHFAGKWQRDIGDQWDATVKRIRDRFTVATAMGRPNNELAGLIRDDVGQIFETGGINNADWAKAFVRTKFTEISNQASVAMALEAGIDRFINMGVPDDRQSDICREASNQPPMTLQEWDASEWGQPPRHVLNCRCELVAVPEGALEEEWTQNELVEARS